jgi:6-phosphogluconolactonase (cycloisomerase 2 family)
LSATWWVGGYGPDMNGTGSGIYSARTAPNGALELVGLAVEVESPSFLVGRGDHVYAALEGAGRVESFRRSDDALVRDGGAESGGKWPCHLAFAGGGLVAANYFNGSLGVVTLDAAGAVAGLAQVVQHEGSGPRPEQGGPHTHASFAVADAALLSLDLGADRIDVHTVGDVRLEPHSFVALAAGTGPRDIARHASGLLYVLGELGGELLVFEWRDAGLRAVASAGLPGFVEGDHAAGISFGPGGFVYVGLRGSQRISVLHAAADGASIEQVGWVSSEGDWPRHQVIDGDVLHVANEHSSSIASFRLGADGMPVLIADPTAVTSPSYLLRRAG